MDTTGTITISHGPQFNGMISRLAFLIGSISLVFGIYALVCEMYVYGILSLCVFAFVAPVFLDYRGVQIDRKNNRIRQYKSY